jgi:hypothetical protein
LTASTSAPHADPTRPSVPAPKAPAETLSAPTDPARTSTPAPGTEAGPGPEPEPEAANDREPERGSTSDAARGPKPKPKPKPKLKLKPASARRAAPASASGEVVHSDLVVVLAPDPGPDFDPGGDRVRRDRRITRRIVLAAQLLLCAFLSWSINNLGIAMCDGESDCRDQAAVLQPWVLGLAVLCVLAFCYGAVRRDRVSQTRVQAVVAVAILLTSAFAVGRTFSGVVWKPAGPDQIERRNPTDYQNIPECSEKGNCPPEVAN